MKASELVTSYWRYNKTEKLFHAHTWNFSILEKIQPTKSKQNNTVFSKRWWHEEIFSHCQVQESRITGIPITVTITIRTSAMLCIQRRAGCCFYLLWVCMPSAWLVQIIQAPTKGRDSTLAAVALELLFYHHWNDSFHNHFCGSGHYSFLEC